MRHCGLIGYPVSHSLSPRMQEAGFAALGIEARYHLWETPLSELEQRLQTLREPQMLGANVTIPHKEAVLPWLDECDPLALRIGAVNTIVNRQGRLIGYNTDAPGFLRALQERAGHAFDLQGKQAVILGTGGAARGAAVAFWESRVGALSILGRTEARIAALLSDLQRLPWRGHLQGLILTTPAAAACLSQADVLVNTTSVGLREDDERLPLEVARLPVQALVMDMIFNPPQTPLLRQAREHGCTVLNGLSMLLYQGTLALELWTDRPAPVEIMRAALGLEG